MTIPRTSFALTHVAVVDTAEGSVRPDQTVLVSDGTLTTVGPSSQVEIPRGTTVHDLTGRYVLPGLADMHVHSEGLEDPRQIPALYVANGVTTVREMWGKPYLHEWRRQTAAGEMLGPRSIIASPIIDGTPGLWEDVPLDAAFTVATTAAEARRAVAESQEGGADFIKTYSRLEREPYFALLDEAQRRGIAVVGHRSDRVPLLEQIGAGQRSFEHVHGVWPATSDDVERLEAVWAAIDPQPGLYYAHWFEQANEAEWEAVTRYDAAAARSVFERMVAEDVAYTPTLVMHSSIDLPEGMDANDEYLRYQTPDTPAMMSFVRDHIYHGGGRTAEVQAKRLALFDRRRAVVAAMDAAGVQLLAGTDAGFNSGFALHEELELLVGAGLTPLRALQAATLEPARFLGREKTSGTVAAGKDADLLVLDADPLTDIRNTRQIHAVVVDGRWVGPDERQRLLDTAAQVAAAAPTPELQP